MENSEVRKSGFCKAGGEKAEGIGAGRDTTASAMQTTYHAVQIREKADRLWQKLQEGWPEDKRRQVRKLQLIRIMEECRALEKTPEARRTKREKERCQVLNIVGEKLFNQVL